MKENLKKTQLGKNKGVSVANSQPNQQTIILLDEYEKDGTGLTEEQRKQLGHASYIKKAPDFVRSKEKELIILKGITTSQVNQALKAKSSYPARVFLKVEGQEQDIPVFFRIKETPTYKGFIKPRVGKYINYSKCYNTSRG